MHRYRVHSFPKEKVFQKEGARASKVAEAIPEVEVIPVVLISEVAASGVPNAPFEVLRNAEVIGEPTMVHDAAGAHDAMDPPIGERSPLWATKASQPTTEVPAVEVIEGDEL